MVLKYVLFLQEDKFQGLLMEIENLILLENVPFLFILAYYWIEKEKIFMEVSFDAGKKGFFSKQEQPCDYFEGKLCQVTP